MKVRMASASDEHCFQRERFTGLVKSETAYLYSVYILLDDTDR